MFKRGDRVSIKQMIPNISCISLMKGFNKCVTEIFALILECYFKKLRRIYILLRISTYFITNS